MRFVSLVLIALGALPVADSAVLGAKRMRYIPMRSSGQLIFGFGLVPDSGAGSPFR